MKTFITTRDKVLDRFDTYYYQPKYQVLADKIKEKNKTKPFGNLIKEITNGLDYRGFSESGVKYLRVGNIGKGYLRIDEVKHVPTEILEEKPQTNTKKGDLLLTRKGSYGMAYSVKVGDEEMAISSEVFNIKLKDEVLPDYIEVILNSKIGQTQFEQVSVGAIMGSLSQDAVKDYTGPSNLYKNQ